MMRMIWLIIGLVLPAQAVSQDAAVSPTQGDTLALMRPKPRPAALADAGRRCTTDGRHCIALDSYTSDVCRVIEATAKEAGLDVGFFARLIWRESLFDAGAISPAGAQGIAQFMPGTAALRDLSDPFNPAMALRASATYLAELRDIYGSLGYAAAAYNAGEARLEDFRDRGRRLPGETRAYVRAITGHSAGAWKLEPPAPDVLNLSLDPDRPFVEACKALAADRRISAFRQPLPDSPPWAVVFTSHRSRDIAAYRFDRLQKQYKRPMRGIVPEYRRARLPGFRGTQMTAQTGHTSRADAIAQCSALRRDGVPCRVIKMVY